VKRVSERTAAPEPLSYPLAPPSMREPQGFWICGWSEYVCSQYESVFVRPSTKMEEGTDNDSQEVIV
jgi:hypothetical protein